MKNTIKTESMSRRNKLAIRREAISVLVAARQSRVLELEAVSIACCGTTKPISGCA